MMEMMYCESVVTGGLTESSAGKNYTWPVSCKVPEAPQRASPEEFNKLAFNFLIHIPQIR